MLKILMTELNQDMNLGMHLVLLKVISLVGILPVTVLIIDRFI